MEKCNRKICSKCKKEKELKDFDRQRITKSGLRSDCKSCRKEQYEKSKILRGVKTKPRKSKRKFNSEEERISARKEYDKLKYINKYSGLTEEEIILKKEALKAYNRQYTHKKRRKAGIPLRKVYKTDEEHKEVKKLTYEKYKSKRNVKPRKKYSEEERKLARKETLKRYYIKHKEKERERQKKYRKENPEKEKLRRKLSRQKRKKERSEYQKNYREKNNERDKPKRNEYSKKRYYTNIIFKLGNNLSTSLKNAFKRKKFSKNGRLKNILGCTLEEFKQHLEKQFKSWMTWENKGNWNGIPKEINTSWDIDHIVPIDTAKTEEELIKLFHYSNLQPLCSYTNRWIKRNTLK